MAATPSIKIEKTTPYKGGVKTWSNRYHFSGGTPANSGAWTTFADAVVAAEKLTMDSDVTIVAAVGYDAGSDIPVFSKTYSVAGTFSASGSFANTPLNTAAIVRYDTDQRTTKNHPIYLFNYYHRAVVIPGAAQDELHHGQKSAFATYGAAWVSGFSDGAHTLKRAGPRGAVAQGVTVGTYVTHRDFRD